jgi:enoyl-CoA hydratase/carnithine racemase
VDVVNDIEASPRPTVAAIEGSCLGWGLEVAMSCHYRVASTAESTQMGLTEVHEGVIPGAGGTQRLPPLIGLQAAARSILTGSMPIKGGNAAVKLHLVDAAVDMSQQTVLEAAKQWAS